jgi:hypothetical protein
MKRRRMPRLQVVYKPQAALKRLEFRIIGSVQRSRYAALAQSVSVIAPWMDTSAGCIHRIHAALAPTVDTSAVRVDRRLRDDLRKICLHSKAPRFDLHRPSLKRLEFRIVGSAGRTRA